MAKVRDCYEYDNGQCVTSQNVCAARIRALRIFDRWGNQLYLNENMAINDESIGWDGTFRGQPMQPGVYVWQAEVEFVDGAVEVFAGDVFFPLHI